MFYVVFKYIILYLSTLFLYIYIYIYVYKFYHICSLHLVFLLEFNSDIPISSNFTSSYDLMSNYITNSLLLNIWYFSCLYFFTHLFCMFFVCLCILVVERTTCGSQFFPFPCGFWESIRFSDLYASNFVAETSVFPFAF